MKYSFLLLAGLLTLSAADVAAQADRYVAQTDASDPQAERVLKSAKLKMNSLSDFTAKFRYSLENRAAARTKTVVKQGNLQFKGGNKYRVDFTDQLLVCDGRTVWNYLKAEKEVNLTAYDPQEGFSFDRIFRLYQDDMKAQYNARETVDGVQVEKVTLFPKKKSSDYFKVEMWVDVRRGIPVKMKVWGRNGSNTTYELSDVRTNSNLGDGTFTFNASQYPDIQVVDMR